MNRSEKFPVNVLLAVNFFQLEDDSAYLVPKFTWWPPFFKMVTRNHLFYHRELVADLSIVELFERSFDALPQKGQAIELCVGYSGIVFAVEENGDSADIDVIIDGTDFDFNAGEDENFTDFMKKMREAGWINLSSGLLLDGH